MTKENVYYSEILALKEAKSFVPVLKKWDKLSENMHNLQNLQMVLPDLFWIAKAGVGKTHLLKLLSEYLYDKGNLMEFAGNVKYFEFMLDYCHPSSSFDEIKRLITEVSNAAGFRNAYKGIVSVDIDEWVDHCEEKHFISFLEYLSANSDYWLIVFNVESNKASGEQIKKLESILSMFFRLEKSELTLPSAAELVDFVSERIGSYGLKLDESALELIKKTIEKLSKNKYFDGYKTLIMLCQDVVYEAYSAGKCNGAVISASDLSEFGPESKFIERIAWNNETKKRIGLIV